MSVTKLIVSSRHHAMNRVLIATVVMLSASFTLAADHLGQSPT